MIRYTNPFFASVITNRDYLMQVYDFSRLGQYAAIIDTANWSIKDLLHNFGTHREKSKGSRNYLKTERSRLYMLLNKWVIIIAFRLLL